MLISPASEKTITSTLGELSDQLARVQMHPQDATIRDIGDGDTIRVFNDLGEVVCPVQLNPDLKPGTLSLPKGLWQKHTMNGSTVNALVADASTDIGGGACFNDVHVEVTRMVTADLGDESLALWTPAGRSDKVH